MKFLFDTNIILNFLIPNNTLHKESSNLIKECLLKKVKGFVSAHSLTDMFFILRKYYSVEDRRQILLLIISNFQLIIEKKEDFLAVLNDLNFFDLEDGLQMRCAEKANLDYIITENLKDFLNSKIPAINIDSALKLLTVSS